MLKFENISLSFEGNDILRDFSLDIKEGEKVLLDAPSGRGKSSLIKIFMGFITPQKGELYFQGKKVDKHSINKVRREVTWVNQDINLRKIKVADLLDEIKDFSSNKDINIYGNLNSLLEDFGLSREYLDKNVEKLSGGERQRLGLIIAILLDRKVLFLDEVTSSLDINMKKKVEEWIVSTDKTVVLVSHDTHWNKENFRVVRW